MDAGGCPAPRSRACPCSAAPHTITPWSRFSFRRFFVALVAFVIVLGIGTVGFVLLTDEGWVAAFYRSVVSTTLTGLDSRPQGRAAELFTVALLLAGVAIFLYLAGAVVELITRGVVGEYFGEGRRRRAIEPAARPHHHLRVRPCRAAASPRSSSTPAASTS